MEYQFLVRAINRYAKATGNIGISLSDLLTIIRDAHMLEMGEINHKRQEQQKALDSSLGDT